MEAGPGSAVACMGLGAFFILAALGMGGEGCGVGVVIGLGLIGLGVNVLREIARRRAGRVGAPSIGDAIFCWGFAAFFVGMAFAGPSKFKTANDVFAQLLLISVVAGPFVAGGFWELHKWRRARRRLRA